MLAMRFSELLYFVQLKDLMKRSFRVKLRQHDKGL
ncbi:unnamed protein product [Anisakis simplex]|uniref:Uncharacterized protein n=1 Tax=Anisakis simplex TaxID=6269 RepID=A0A3P6UG21_ANISI|nr:unnamed protein product [Anisakis simplex]